MTASPSHRAPPGRWPILALVAVFGFGAALRAVSAGGDLWIDEVWSLNQLAIAQASGTLDVWVSLFFHDNTHALNTLYLHLMGPGAPMWAYRMLSVVTGVGAIGAAAALGWRRGAWPGVILAALVAVNYPLVHYSGEARGYGPMLFAVLVSIYTLEGWLWDQKPSWAVAFVAASVFGLLSHLTFAVVLGGLGLWALVEIHARSRSIVTSLARLMPLFGLPFLMIVAYGAVAFRSLVIGGTTFEPAVLSVSTMAQLMFGFDPTWLGPIPGLIFIALLSLIGIACLWRCAERSWIFFLILAVAFPAGAIAAETAPYILPRYVIAGALAAVLLAAWCGLLTWKRGGEWRLVVQVALAIYFIGHVQLLLKFLEQGRGQYGDVVEIVSAVNGPVAVAGAPGFSVGSVLRYHAKRLGHGDRVRFSSDDPNATWYIKSTSNPDGAPVSIRNPNAGEGEFGVYAIFPHWGLSGDTWVLYKRR